MFQQQDTVGQLYSDSKTKASILQDQFISEFTTDYTDTNHDLKMDGQRYKSIPPLLVRDEGILKPLQHINPSQSSGPDEVAGRLLKELTNELAPFLTYLFNKSLETGEVLTKWKEQWANPIFKSGTKSEAANYRPVSLMCIMSKLMEHVVCSHIRAHLDKMSILSPFQHGFRSGFSCETQLLLTFHDLANIHGKGLRTLVFWTSPKPLMLSPIRYCLTSSPIESRRWWQMEHFQMRHLLLVEFLRGPSSGPCCFFHSSTICLPQHHPELGYYSLRMTASSTTPSKTHMTKSCFNMTLTTWSTGPSNGECGSTLQSARSWWTNPPRGTESNIPRCDPILWPNLVTEHPSCCQQG